MNWKLNFKYFLACLAGVLMSFAQGKAQSLIIGLDTLCIENEIQLSTTVKNASTYYWGFCSAYLNNIPTGSSIVSGTGLNSPSAIALGKDGANYHVFVVNTNAPYNLIRYDFGTLLSNLPVAVNLGNFSGAIPNNAKGFELVQTGGNWYGFITGGITPAASELIRLDFGASLSNVPTVVSLGNLGGALSNPQDLFVFNTSNNWYAFTTNAFTGDLIRINFGASITGIPTTTNLGNPGSLDFPTGMNAVFDGNNWYLFVVNRVSQAITRLDFGTSLLNVPTEVNLGGFLGALIGPRDITIIRDCDAYYGYVSNESSSTIVKLDFGSNISNPPVVSDLGNFAGFSGPRFFTRFLRDKDNVFCFTANNNDNSLSRIEYNSCTISSIQSSTLQTPPAFTYTSPGIYNVYFVADEGLPTMQVDCKQIVVRPKPYYEITRDTLICEGDTILLVCNGPGLYSMLWDPVYNGVPPYDTTSMRVYPREDYRYFANMEFSAGGGCSFDTSMLVKVSKVFADAGPDRFVADGSYTKLGGPRISMGQEYKYFWKPNLYLDANNVPNPTCRPLDVQAYYLTVTNDTTGCVARDSVWVFTECTDIILPNAFNPVSDIPANREFGLLNNRVVKLEYFRIYNRWGQVVFETSDPKKQWNGRQNNLDLPPDNYVWIVDGYCDNGKRIKKQGTVLLVR